MEKYMLTLDFETEAIEGNTSKNPPKPVGVAVKQDGAPARYLSWGHPTGNNISFERARTALKELIDLEQGHILCQHAKFDTAVLRDHMGLEVPHWSKVEDTMYLLFFENPYAKTLSLKPSAEHYLNLPPEEQNALHDWIVSNVAEAAARPSTAGAYISRAPASLVGPYAIGDVDRTWQLFQLLHGRAKKAGMLQAYDREKRLMPIMQESERHGIRVDMERLHTDLAMYEQTYARADDEVRQMLNAPGLNLDSGEEFADAVERAGYAGQWARTPTGRRSTAKGVIEQGIKHAPLVRLFRYRNALSTCLTTFMRPWAALAAETGRMHPNWNQVKNARNDKDLSGTKTGRLSCDHPNFQNPSNEFTLEVPPGYPELPLVRRYIVPDEGMVWLKRDYSQQELRVLAHFAEGAMLDQYKAAPRTDFHSLAAEMIKEATGIKMERKMVKIIAFSILYGSGAAAMAAQMGCDIAEAQSLKKVYLETFPGIKSLSKDLSARGKAGESMRTWGGRVYYSEPPSISKKTGRMQEYHYKLLNYLIQGSSADCTKEAVIAYEDTYKQHGRFLLTVHDELDICAPVEHAESEMKALNAAMESPKFDVPMMSDGFIGPNWFDLESYHV